MIIEAYLSKFSAIAPAADMTGQETLSETAERGSYWESVAAYQGRLLSYIASLLGNVEVAADVLQETNVVLLSRWREFEPGTDFKAWSFRIAHFQALASRQRKRRERVEFDNDLLALLAVEANRQDEFWDMRAQRLAICIEQLNARHRDLIRMRYVDRLNTREIGDRLQRSANAVFQILFRVRARLIECVKRVEPD